MKIILTLFFISTYIFACTGDCMTCHPSLAKNIQNDERHKSMLGCVKCHAPNPESMAECGSDCYSCHPVIKMESTGIKEHMVIRKCRDCHMKMKVDLNIATPTGQSSMPSLRDFLSK